MIDTKKISGVPETMLFTFYMKYLESVRPGGLVSDARYGSVLGRIDYDFEKFTPYSEESPLLLSCRSLVFDDAVRRFAGEHPSATVVSFGSGLDFRFERIDNGSLLWYDIDLPEVIEIRRRLYAETERLGFVPCSALDFSWAGRIRAGGSVLFLAEGLLVYFSPGEVREFILFLLERFPGSRLLFDAYSTLYVENVRKGTPYEFFNSMVGLWRWSLDGIHEVERLSPGIRLLEERRPMEMYGERAPGYLKDLMASGLKGFVKEQVLGMVRVFLLGLDPQNPREEDPGMPDELFDTVMDS